jgi:hypothetical protein
LLRTVMLCGLTGHEKSPRNLPPPSFESVPISWLLEVTNARKVAVARVLVASTRSLRLPLSYSARVIETVSAPPPTGLIVKVVERDVPLSEAVIRALVVACTCVVLMLKLLDLEPAGTTTLFGTVAAALLLAIATVVAAGATAVSVTVPVEELPPVTVVGFNDKLATPRGGDGVGVGGGTPPVVLVKTSVVGAPAPPSTKAMSGLASAFQSPARIMMPPLLGGGTR